MAAQLPGWLRELGDAFECPVCTEPFLDPPVFVCENQHELCWKCRKKVMDKDQAADRICPVCRGRLTNKRSLGMEKIVAKIPKKKCRYQTCTFSRSEIELVPEHEADCSERDVKCAYCPVSACTQPLSSIQDHLISAHDKKLASYSKNKWQTGGWQKLPSKNIEQKSMLTWKIDSIPTLFNTVVVDTDYLLIWVSVLGTKEEAENLEYSIRIYNEKDRNAEKKKYLYQGTMRCAPCDISHEDMKKCRLGFFLSRTLMEKACEGNDKGRFLYDIKFNDG